MGIVSCENGSSAPVNSLGTLRKCKIPEGPTELLCVCVGDAVMQDFGLEYLQLWLAGEGSVNEEVCCLQV